MRNGLALTIGGVALLASAALVVPALGAPASGSERERRPVIGRGLGQFTPASADPRLAASLARASALGNAFRFTPSSTVAGRTGTRAVTVAVRSTDSRRQTAADRTVAPNTRSTTVGASPIAYNLGLAVGWRRFALSGEVSKVDTGVLPGSREQVDVGVSYSAPRFTARLAAERDAPADNQPRLVTGEESYSVDLGGSYRLTRNLDVTAGVRYRSERDRLRLDADDRRDSQAVYVGTAFRF